MQNKNICIAFLGNAFNDSRIVNLKNSLTEDGCKVSVISFDWFIKKQNIFTDDIKVFKLHKGRITLFFYLHFATILIRELIKTKAEIYFAEDFYTLPFVVLIGKFKRAKVYYNSRELYAYIGGLRNKPILQSIIRIIEKFFIKKVDLVLTTGEMDSKFLEDFYKINNTLVIRNIPLYQQPKEIFDFRKKFNLPENSFLLLYQGVLLEGRGIPIIINALKELDNTYLIILGEGEQKNKFIKLANEIGVSEKVIFAGVYEQNELIKYTAGADVGLALIENISISYYHALPNKLFEYIMAGLPVIVSNLPQMKKIVEDYNVGKVVDIEKGESIVPIIKHWQNNRDIINTLKNNCIIAAKELNWQEEYKRIKDKFLI
ncbi:glycosyltransferase [Rosettibacter firmus]|uniref:glycosyltransferase n=1 Tax=Rosettibacter firmus TaxID=3111522 RepID=UPI00336C03F1